MLNKLRKIRQQKSERGFTIIEVMIVLAIAGLILLIVFLAVPALQRNARNTTRKNDVAAILAAISEYESNNNGALPTTCSGTNPVQIGTAAVGSQAKVGYYTSGCVTAAVTDVALPQPPPGYVTAKLYTPLAAVVVAVNDGATLVDA